MKSTFAWTQASSNATGAKSTQTMVASVSVSDATLAASTYYVKLTMAPNAASVNMTSSDGEVYGVSNSVLVKADKTQGTNVDYFTLSATWSKSPTADSALSADDYAKIAADATGLEFNITHNSGSRIRLAQGTSAPAVSGTTLGATAKVKVTWDLYGANFSFSVKVGEGSYAAYDTNKIYYSVAGQLAVQADVDASAASAVGDDLSSTRIDAAYVGQTASAETTVGLANALKLNIA